MDGFRARRGRARALVRPMEAHLSSGCARCAANRGRVAQRCRHRRAAKPATSRPSTPSGMRRRSTRCTGRKPRVFPRLVARLVHDSFRAPLPAGMRAAESARRGTRCTRPEAITSICSWSISLRPGWSRWLGNWRTGTSRRRRTADVPVWLMERKSAAGEHALQPLRRVSPGVRARARPSAVCPASRGRRSVSRSRWMRLTPGSPTRQLPAGRLPAAAGQAQVAIAPAKTGLRNSYVKTGSLRKLRTASYFLCKFCSRGLADNLLPPLHSV